MSVVRRGRVAPATWALLAALAVTARARVAPAQAPEVVEQARRRFDAGVALIDQERWNEAITELRAARDLYATPAVFYNLGRAQRAVGRYRDAVASFQSYLRGAGERAPADRVREVRGYVDELLAALGHLSLAVEPPGANVRVDGEGVPAGTRALDVDPGTHVVLVEAAGYTPDSRTVDVPRGDRVEIIARLVPLGTAGATPAAPRPHLRVEPDARSATVLIDGHEVGTGVVDEAVAPGAHRVEVRAPGRVTFRRSVVVNAAGTTRVDAALARATEVWESPWFWVVAGGVVAGALVAGGVVLFSGPEAPVVTNSGVVFHAVTRADGP